jgi:hypothetical protein
MHLVAIGREDLIDGDVDIGTQLEFGVSSRTLLSLIELGLSRVSAVALYEKIARDDLSKEDCIAWVRERDTQFEGMDIPAISQPEATVPNRSKKPIKARRPAAMNSAMP